MKNKVILFVIVLLLVICTSSYFFISNNNQTNKKTESTSTAEISTATTIPSVSKETETKYEWVIKPKLDYSLIVFDPFAQNYQGIINYKDGESHYVISSETGEETGESILGDSIGIMPFCDPQQNILGTRTYTTWGQQLYGEGDITQLDSIADIESVIKTHQKIATLIPLQKADFSSATSFSNKYALANTNDIITDFIYDDVDGYYNTSTFAVCKNNKWGFINDKGEQIIDFVFDGAVSIETGKAFVKQNDKWGIIKITIE